jgi:hypothetical protein
MSLRLVMGHLGHAAPVVAAPRQVALRVRQMIKVHGQLHINITVVVGRLVEPCCGQASGRARRANPSVSGSVHLGLGAVLEVPTLHRERELLMEKVQHAFLARLACVRIEKERERERISTAVY